jgi:hypothetical protein
MSFVDTQAVINEFTLLKRKTEAYPTCDYWERSWTTRTRGRRTHWTRESERESKIMTHTSIRPFSTKQTNERFQLQLWLTTVIHPRWRSTPRKKPAPARIPLPRRNTGPGDTTRWMQFMDWRRWSSSQQRRRGASKVYLVRLRIRDGLGFYTRSGWV